MKWLRQALLILLEIFSFVSLGWAQNTEANSFSDTSLKSVVYVQTQFFMDSSLSQEASLWSKVDKWAQTKLLGNYVTVSTGSGFFVDTQGHILTNAHVVEIKDVGALRAEIITSLQDSITHDVPLDVLSDSEKFQLRVDVARILAAATPQIRIWVPGGQTASAVVNDVSPSDDLALLSIQTDKTTRPLLLSPVGNLRVGDSVWAIGYPLGTIFKQLFKTPQASVSQGIVSAIRNDNWGIQHTAALNPGNSGGPLLDKFGNVVGVNVGLITNSTGLFFSIPVSRVVTFLKKNGLSSILQANELLRHSRSIENSLSTYEVGKSVVIISDVGARISSKGHFLGTAPLVLSMDTPAKVLTIIGSDGSRTITLRRNTQIQDTSTVNVVLMPFEGALRFTSDPAGASVVVDGTPIGVTPGEKEISAGTHIVQFFLDGYKFSEKSIVVRKGQLTRVASNGSVQIPFTFSEPLPSGTTFDLTNGSHNIQLVDPPKLTLSTGVWHIVVSNPGQLRNISFDLDTEKSPREINVKSWFDLSSLVFTGSLEGCTVKIDGQKLLSPQLGKSYSVSAGTTHTIMIERPDYHRFTVDVKLEPQQTKTIVVNMVLLPEAQKSRDLWTSGLMTWGGVGLIAGGVALASLPSEPNVVSEVGAGTAITGLIVTLIGSIWFNLALNE